MRIDQPRIVVRWASSASPDARDAVAGSFGLVHRRSIERNGSADADSFLPIDPDEEALVHLRRHPAVQAVEVLEVSSDAPPVRSADDRLSPALAIERVPPYAWLLEWQVQSTVLLLAGGALLAGSLAARPRVRTAIALGCILIVAVAALSLPLDAQIHMGDAEQYTASRAGFENVFGDRVVGFESHLSSRLLWWLDQRLGADAASPALAMRTLARGAAWWYVAMLLCAAASLRFSPAALRYLALAMAAPASLMYFGYRELGYLSLTPAAFPLVVQGIRDRTWRLDAGAALAGLGAALHGFGLLSLVGAAAATLTARVPYRERLGMLGRAVAFGATTYVGWIFVYVVAFRLTIDPSDAGEIPWRSPTATATLHTYVNWALFSVRGALEVAAACWVVGVPLAIAALAARGHRDERGAAFAFALPSFVFLPFFWPIQGLAAEADLLVAAFPAIYALAWLAAQSTRDTLLGLILLASSHVVYWRVAFSDAFVASRL